MKLTPYARLYLKRTLTKQRITVSICILTILLLILGNLSRLSAQTGNSAPKPLAQGLAPLSTVPVLMTTSIDLPKLQAEDRERHLAGLPPRFAQPIAVDAQPATHGVWETLDIKTQVWRLRIHAPDAVSINLGFSHYHMPTDGQLFIYTPDYQTIIGPFTTADNETHGQLWTPVLRSKEIVLELIMPTTATKTLALTISAVNHGYVELHKAGQSRSGACNVDVACAVADNWRDEINAIGRYTVSGTFFCTGALINNTAQDYTPYFLTADHCNITAGNAASVVVYWDYEHSTCRTPGEPDSGQSGDGSLAQFNSGAILRANYPASDMALIELDDPVDTSTTPYWAGWDKADLAPITAVSIHHPQGEEKRISFEDDTTMITDYNSHTNSTSGTHIRVGDWDLGTTEPGSSGSPLFNQDQRIVGQLEGGQAACGNDLPDWYGRLFTSWSGGGIASTRLSDWLDPLNSNPTTLNGLGVQPDFTLNVSPIAADICLGEQHNFTITLGSMLNFSDTVTLSADGLPVGASSSFSANAVTPPATSTLTISTTAAVVENTVGITLTGVSAARTRTRHLSLNFFDTPPLSPTLIAPLNGTVGQTILPMFVWSSTTAVDTYHLEIATNPTFNPLVHSITASNTVHQLTIPLAANTQYYWRITPENACGQGLASEIYTFTTATQYCSLPNAPIPDNMSQGLIDSLVITTSAQIDDLNLFIMADHDYVGDLSFRLNHLETGTDAVVIDRPGVPETTFGCSGQDIAVTLDDEALTPVEDACSTDPPAITGSLSPNHPLAHFNGDNLQGTWQLIVSDGASSDTGTLRHWCLLPATSAISQPILTISKAGPSSVQHNALITYTLTVTNTGYTATHLLITDTIPNGTDFAYNSPLPADGAAIFDGNFVSWTVDELPGFGGQIDVTFTVTATGIFSDTTVTASTPKIVGGIEAVEGSWPWMASIARLGIGPWCGGSLIHPEWVLTAAHCINGVAASDFKVILGRHDLTTTVGEEFAVMEIRQHPNFNGNTFDNDIALLRLASLSSQPTLNLVNIHNDDVLPIPIDTSVTVMGWGALSQGGSSPDTLHQVSVPIVANETCNTPIAYNGDVTENMVCAGLAQGGKDACQGDSGGPLVMLDAPQTIWLQVGIVSWGVGCAQPNKYGVYTRLSNYADWILSHTGPLGMMIINDDYRVSSQNGGEAMGQIAVMIRLEMPPEYRIHLPLILKD